jgi:hypothetical protein
MSREDFLRQLEDAANRIAEIPRHELQILLRRAAIRLRNLPATDEHELDAEYQRLMDEMNRPR